MFQLKDPTPIWHALCALGWQIALWLACGLVGAVVGGLMGFAYYAGREIAQAEKRPADWPASAADKWYRGLYFWRWNLGSQQDLLYPAAAVALATALAAWV